jgi:hypothetical protein
MRAPLLVSGAGAGLALLLALGLANPPLGNPIFRTAGPAAAIPLASSLRVLAWPSEAGAPNLQSTQTIVITGWLSEQSAPLAAWGVLLMPSQQAILLSADAYLSLPSQRGWQSFFHIRPAGQVNSLYLHVEARTSTSDEITIRINNEIAWRGWVAAGQSLALVAGGGQYQLLGLAVYE